MFRERRKFKEFSEIRQCLILVPISLASLMALIGFPSGLFALFIPIFLLPIADFVLSKFSAFILPVMALSLVIAVSVFLILRYRLKINSLWILPLATATFVASVLIGGELQTTYLMSSKLKERNFDCVSIKSFWHSLHIAGREFQFNLHTSAMKDGKSYGWSFRQSDFYEIPSSAVNNITPAC